MTQRPKRLYKYRTFSDKTLRLLTEAEVYYANPNTFNDPLDSQPIVNVDIDPHDIERLLHRMIKETKGKSAADQAINEHLDDFEQYKSHPKATEYYTRNLTRDIERRLRSELGQRGVLSLAKKWDCPLMWSHYADQHRGLCIEYDMCHTAFSHLRPISYQMQRGVQASDLVAWKIKGDSTARERIFNTVFFTKAPQWRYEHEWRDLITKNAARSAPAEISAVYFGFRCDTSVITTVVRLYRGLTRKVKFYNIYPQTNSFRLKRRLVNTDEINASGMRDPIFKYFKDLSNDGAGI